MGCWEGSTQHLLATSEKSPVLVLSWLLCFPVCKAVRCCVQMRTVTKEVVLVAKHVQVLRSHIVYVAPKVDVPKC